MMMIIDHVNPELHCVSQTSSLKKIRWKIIFKALFLGWVLLNQFLKNIEAQRC